MRRVLVSLVFVLGLVCLNPQVLVGQIDNPPDTPAPDPLIKREIIRGDGFGSDPDVRFARAKAYMKADEEMNKNFATDWPSHHPRGIGS